MAKISEILKENKPTLSFEVFPPKTEDKYEGVLSAAKQMSKLHPSFISVTYGAAGGTRAFTTNIAGDIASLGVPSLAHLTCVSSTKESVDEALAQYKAHGIENILALLGDRNPNVPPKNDFAHACDLIKFVRENSSLSISAACYPEGHPEAESRVSDIRHLKEKVDAGATHLISQLFFDNDVFYRFQENVKIAGIDLPVDAGIMPVVNKAQIERMITLCGASLPVKFQKILTRYENDKVALFDAGMAYAVNQIIDLIASGVDGIHIYTMNNPRIAEKLTSAIKNLF
jgi:methylenetetrahydrofolate reductase (NADPH)